jgi:hypothetical protein
MMDNDGRPMIGRLTPASVQDRDGAPPPLKASRASFPFGERAFTDASATAFLYAASVMLPTRRLARSS